MRAPASILVDVFMSIVLLGVLALVIGSAYIASADAAQSNIIAQAENAAGGHIYLTRDPCPPKNILLHSDHEFYSTSKDGKKILSGCFGVIKSAIGPMVFVIDGENLHVYPAGAFHPYGASEQPKAPPINKQDWL